MAIASPPATPAMSQDSTVFGFDSSLSLDDAKSFRRQSIEQGRPKRATTSRDILIILIAFRIANALSIKTFFQPDEFFQSLEPAWEIAFGANSGAWITWEWTNYLRSAIHPALFAIVYSLTSTISWMFHLSPTLHANLLIAAPKAGQAICAAIGDFYTWRLGQKIFGFGSKEALTVLILTVCSPWQWFCSTRTLSNCLETTLTIVALYHWPWEISIKDEKSHDNSKTKIKDEDDDYIHVGEGSPRISDFWKAGQIEEKNEKASLPSSEDHTIDYFRLRKSLRRCLFLAALACILRPTNILIWICLTGFALFQAKTYGKFMEIRCVASPVWVHVTSLRLFPATHHERKALFVEVILCGSSMLLLSTVVDTLYYQKLTFPPLRFLYFNVAQSLAVFYGKNRWDYYFTEGLPLLLTTYLPFAIQGLYQSLSSSRESLSVTNNSASAYTIRYQLATTCIMVILVLSLISHKEVRFIYPLLPLFHLLTASPFTSFFFPSISPAKPSISNYNPKRLVLLLLILTNITIALLATTSHQPGTINVLHYLRQQHITHYLTQPPPLTLSPAPSTMTVGFLMPCHSTPWRSHLIFPTIKAWALGCDPPVNLNATEKAIYIDEADRFYASPKQFLSINLGKPPIPRAKSPAWWFGWFGWARKVKRGFGRDEMIEADAWDGRPGGKIWPEYLVFFQEKETLLQNVLKVSAYRECWRGWNSWGHDDWRRQGDVIVWCLRSQKEKKRSWLKW